MKTRNGGIVDNGDYLLFYWGRMKTEKLANALASLLLTHPKKKRWGWVKVSLALFFQAFSITLW